MSKQTIVAIVLGTGYLQQD